MRHGERIILDAIISFLGITFMLTLFGVVYGNVIEEKARIADDQVSSVLEADGTYSEAPEKAAIVYPTSQVISSTNITVTPIIINQPDGTIIIITPTTTPTSINKPVTTPSQGSITPTTNIPTTTIRPTPTATTGPNPTATPAPTSTPAPTPVTTAYMNGIYTVLQKYTVEGKQDSITVQLTIQNDYASNLVDTYTYSSTKSKKYQDSFESNIRSLVVGKAINNISLSRVGGASITTNAFNQAFSQIKNNARN